MPTPPLDLTVSGILEKRLANLEETIKADCVSIFSPIAPGLEQRFTQALLAVPDEKRKPTLAVILQTIGGVVEIADRMVQASRHFYKEIHYYIPDIAMSAGTIMAMSGDKIMMSPISALGPIDPQIPKGDKWIPALAYLSEFEALIEKNTKGKLTAAEFAVLEKFDIGELHTFKQARDLSIELLERWLSTYKFKDWTITEGSKKPVTDDMKKERAKAIAKALSDHNRWHSHARFISMDTLTRDLGLKIDNYWDDKNVKVAVTEYWELLKDFLTQKGWGSFVHSRYYS